MRDLAALIATYYEVDALFGAIISQYSSKGDHQAVLRTEDRRCFNDQAYFVLCWGQLELAIDHACRTAIRKRLLSSDWNVRRAWDRYNPEEKRLSGLAFEDRVALVLDRRGGAGSPWARVQFYYALRNQMAHGRLKPDRVHVTAVITEFYQIQSALTI